MAGSVRAEWKKLHEGLEFGTFLSPQKSTSGDSLIRILRIDPKHFGFRLLNASEEDESKPYSAREWCKRAHLVAAINANMYQKDYITSVSLMRKRNHINNPRLSKDKAILAFGRKTSQVPPIKIIDLQCENYQDYKKHYSTFIQSIRMISCKGVNVWKQQKSAWSTAAIATDKSGRVLFIHVRSPYTTHDLIENLLKLPIGIRQAMYAEGGPPAQLYIAINGHEYEFHGVIATGLGDTTQAGYAWPIPNVVGIYPLHESPDRK